MDRIFTKERFESAARYLSGYRMTFSHVLNESRNCANADSWQKTIFLSHSHYDAKYVNVARKFFENLGISIYVDWADESMPSRTCGETAQRIKSKIMENDFFILLATDLAIMSKWCNWEVGIGDTYKMYKDKIALLPLADSSRDWNGNEYLQLYPYIKEPEYAFMNDNADNYKIHYPNGHEISLKKWLLK